MSKHANQLARRVAEHLLGREGTGPAWGIELEDVQAGFARIAMVVRGDMLNGHRTAHGGMIFSLADTAFAYACNSRNVSTMAQQASIAFLRPALEGERLVAEAREQSLVGRSGVYTVTVRNQQGEDVAVFQGLSRAVGGAVIDEG